MKWTGNAHRGPSSSIFRVDDIHVYCRGDNLDSLQTTQRRQIPMKMNSFSSTACLALRHEVAPAQPLSSSTPALTRTAGRPNGSRIPPSLEPHRLPVGLRVISWRELSSGACYAATASIVDNLGRTHCPTSHGTISTTSRGTNSSRTTSYVGPSISTNSCRITFF